MSNKGASKMVESIFKIVVDLRKHAAANLYAS
jgi:hypothetical protein